jgi:hypothetical protein
MEKIPMIPALSLAREKRLVAADGATAELEGAPGSERLAIRSASGTMLFEYHADGTSRCVVHAPEGDLALRADRGAITLEAAQGVAIRTPGPVALGCGRFVGEVGQAQLEAQDLTLRATTIRSFAQRVQSTFGVGEIRVGRWIERFGAVYREVEKLSQTRAGRIRTIARETLQVLGRRAVFKAEADLKLKGESIHLG